jgi:alkanesulfonate monooxygenase SsuD/methylene tetrahydromethanopterin reductase-like flavin-dependent oxidoreductase (luciferase family)
MCSDYFTPWSEGQGQRGVAWSWLGAAMQATELSFGMVCAPGQRYHPAIIAQAAATRAELFPGRLWGAFGSGQFMNEHITGAGLGASHQNGWTVVVAKLIQTVGRAVFVPKPAATKANSTMLKQRV